MPKVKHSPLGNQDDDNDNGDDLVLYNKYIPRTLVAIIVQYVKIVIVIASNS